jgi:hypothetical protein
VRRLWTSVGATLLLLVGCAQSHVVETRDGGTPALPDAGVDAFADVGAPPDVGGPFVCRGELGHGSFAVNLDGTSIDLPYVVAGIDSGFCNTLHLRAGDTPTFDRYVLELEVSAGGEELPFERTGFARFWDPSRDAWPDEIRVNVRVERVDGVIGEWRPESEWRARATVSAADDRMLVEGVATDAPYCPDFPRCLI